VQCLSDSHFEILRNGFTRLTQLVETYGSVAPSWICDRIVTTLTLRSQQTLNGDGADGETSLWRGSHANASPIHNLLPHTPPEADFLGWSSPGQKIVGRLKAAGFRVKKLHCCDWRVVALKLKLPTARLEQIAERRRMRVRYTDGRLERFRVAQRDRCVLAPATGSVFRSSERQAVIDWLIRAKRSDGGAELSERTPLGGQIIDRVPLHMKARLDDLKSVWSVAAGKGAPHSEPRVRTHVCGACVGTRVACARASRAHARRARARDRARRARARRATCARGQRVRDVTSRVRRARALHSRSLFVRKRVRCACVGRSSYLEWFHTSHSRSK